MRKSFSVTCLFFLMLGVFIGCKATDKKDASTVTEEATRSSQPVGTNAANVEPKPEGRQIQYMAVCTDKQAHGGNDYVLTKWLDSRDKAAIYGREHERKKKGHVVKYNERDKP